MSHTNLASYIEQQKFFQSTACIPRVQCSAPQVHTSVFKVGDHELSCIRCLDTSSRTQQQPTLSRNLS